MSLRLVEFYSKRALVSTRISDLNRTIFTSQQMGVKKDIFKAMDFDFIEMIKTDSRFVEVKRLGIAQRPPGHPY